MCAIIWKKKSSKLGSNTFMKRNWIMKCILSTNTAREYLSFWSQINEKNVTLRAILFKPNTHHKTVISLVHVSWPLILESNICYEMCLLNRAAGQRHLSCFLFWEVLWGPIKKVRALSCVTVRSFYPTQIPNNNWQAESVPFNQNEIASKTQHNYRNWITYSRRKLLRAVKFWCIQNYDTEYRL